MAMPRKVTNKYSDSSTPSVPVVSTNCSSLRSLYRTCRSRFSCSDLSSHPYLPVNQSSRTTSSVQLLEHELAKLDELLSIQEKNVVDGVNDNTEPANGCGWKGMLRLVDGGYLFDLSENLAMQVSAPALIPVEVGSSFSQVYNRMALMGKEKLIKWLLKSMPMCDLSKTRSEVDWNVATSASSEEGFLEAILIEGVEKLEILALEGLKAQVSGKFKVKNKKAAGSTKAEFEVGDGLMEVMLMQMRDPAKGYECVGETMIGLIEARLGERDESGFRIRGIHVAGSNGDGKDCGYLWSVSLKNVSEESCRSSSDMILRNPDIALTS